VTGKQLGFIPTHSQHPQGPQRGFPSTARKSNISLHGGENRKDRGRRKDIGSHISPTTDTPKEGRPNNNKENGEAQVPNKLNTNLIVEELLMCIIWLEPIKGPSQESYNRRRRTKTKGTYIREPLQQLKQEQIPIDELYQERRELRQQLATKTLEASTSQGREGNMKWLKRNLREA
jgi:hypothetical protein